MTSLWQCIACTGGTNLIMSVTFISQDPPAGRSHFLGLPQNLAKSSSLLAPRSPSVPFQPYDQWPLHEWIQSSCPVPRGLYYPIKLDQKMFTSPTYLEQTSGTVHFRVNTCKALRDIVHSGMLFTSGLCAAAPLVAGGLQQPYDQEPLHIYCKKYFLMYTLPKRLKKDPDPFKQVVLNQKCKSSKLYTGAELKHIN